MKRSRNPWFFGAVVASALFFLAAPGVFGQDSDALQAYRDGNFDMAIQITQKEIQANSQNMDSYAVLGWSLNSEKRYQEAIQWAQKGRQVSSSDHRHVGILAEANYALKNDVAAIGFYQQYVDMTSQLAGFDPRYIRDAYRDLAEVFARIGELHHADMSLSAAVFYDVGKSALDPIRSARLWARLGAIREQLQDYPSALTAFQKALTLDGSNTDAATGRDRVRGKLGPSSSIPPAQG